MAYDVTELSCPLCGDGRLQREKGAADGVCLKCGRSVNLQVADTIGHARKKLIDTSGRTSLISFKHSERSVSQLRIIDELPDEVVARLESGKSFTFSGLPQPQEIPDDERTPKFAAEVERRRTTDKEYLEELSAYGRRPGQKVKRRAERSLRDRIRQEFGMHPFSSVDRNMVVAAARNAGLATNYDLPESPSRKEGSGHAAMARALYHDQSESKSNISRNHTDGALQTLMFEDDLEARLKKIWEKARSIENEMGRNDLFLAVGFLEWYESTASDKSITSPVILVPVGLRRELKGGKYVCALA